MTALSFPTFVNLPAATLDTIGHAPVAIFGASEATPYDPATASHSAGAPAAIRAASHSFAGQMKQHDFDLDATLFPDSFDDDKRRIGVDLGDVPTLPSDAEANCRTITQTTRAVLDAGAVPIVLGGDDSVPIPFLAGFEGRGPVTVVQIDAHVDWADEIRGVANGYGSPMRRAAELEWVTGMLQIGIRGLGSGERWQHDDARGWGSRLVTSREWRRRGCETIVETLPEGGNFVLSIDCDGFDPAAFPAVAMPTPGGLIYDDAIDLFHALARRGRIAGLILAEYVPDRDDGVRSCAAFAARLAMVAMGLMRQ